MPVAAGELFRCTFDSLVSGQICQNVLHFRGRTGAESAASVAAELNTNWWPLMGPLISNLVLFKQITVQQLTPVVFDLVVQGNTSGTANGQVSAGVRNNQVAGILTLRTGVAGKTHRGRMYLAGFPFTSDEQTMSSAGVAACNTFATAALARYGTGGSSAICEWGIYSRLLGGSGPFTVAGYQPITRIDPQAILGAQRRRRLGVGI